MQTKQNLLVALIAIASIIISGCGVTWEPVSEKNKIVTVGVMSVEMPAGWNVIRLDKNNNVASKDGPALNALFVEELPFKDIEKILKIKLSHNMDALEASKQYMAFWSSQTKNSTFDVVREDYVERDGKGHYIIEWTFKDENGTTIRNLAQGRVEGGSIFNIHFIAPQIHYYDKSIQAAENALKTVTYTI